MKWVNAVLEAARRGLRLSTLARFLAGFGMLASFGSSAHAQLFTNLQSLGTRLKAGDPSVIATSSPEGPKGIATADFDGDGRIDLAIAGTTNGLRQVANLGDASFETVIDIHSLAATNWDFPKPVYAMKAFRVPGDAFDSLAVAHADGDDVWILKPTNGVLEVQTSIYSRHVHALNIGAITTPGTNAIADLVTVSRDRGTLEVHRGTS